MVYSIEAVSESNAHLWEDFNNRSREGTVYHSMRWKTLLEDVLKLKVRYYLIREGQKVTGICPFVERSMKMLRGLNDIPHVEFNNMILDETFDADHINDVLSLFAEDYSFLRFNTYHPTLYDKIGYYTIPSEDGGNLILTLKRRPPEDIWSGFSRNMRQNIQIFEKKGFEIREVHQESDVHRFYRYYVENLTHINGTILPFTFFQRLLELYPSNELRFVTLTNDNTFAGGWLALISPDRKTACYHFLALNRNLPNRFTPTYAVYWDLVNWAWESGCEKLSFGRERLDPESPRFRGKTKFGAEVVPINSRLVLFSKAASTLYRLKRGLNKG